MILENTWVFNTQLTTLGVTKNFFQDGQKKFQFAWISL